MTPRTPVPMQGVSTLAERVIHAEDLEDAVSEDFDSPTPRTTHRYPDRALFVVTEMGKRRDLLLRFRPDLERYRERLR